MTEPMWLFSQIVASRITGEKLSSPVSEETLADLYPMAKRQDLAHLVCHAIEEEHLLAQDSPLLARYKKQLHLSILRCHRIEYEKERLIALLDEAALDHIPLKGAVLRPLYPEPWMRTSCDLDILVRETDVETAAALIQSVGYTDLKRNFHDYSLIAPSGVHLELHFRLVEGDANTDPLLERVWEHAHPISEGSHTFEMELPFLYFHILAHAAYHFTSGGGCGLRPLIDLYLLRKHRPCDEAELDRLLTESHLSRFYASLTALADRILDHGTGDAHSERLLAYLLRGSIYGLMEHQIAYREHQHPTTASYLSHRLFLSAKTLQYRYPILKKHPWLTPLCNLSRWIELLFNGRMAHSMREWRLMRRSQKQPRNPVAELIRDLGLTPHD